MKLIDMAVSILFQDKTLQEQRRGLKPYLTKTSLSSKYGTVALNMCF